MAAIQCPGCGKWVPDYSDECWDCGYEFEEEECSCSCSCDDEDGYSSGYACDSGGGHNYYHDKDNYDCSTKQCSCGKWVPAYSTSCWTCGYVF